MLAQVGFPDQFQPVVETIVWLAAGVTGAGVIWQKVLGPFIARPLGKVIKSEVREVMEEQFQEVRQDVDHVKGQLEVVLADLDPIEEDQPLKQLVLALSSSVRQTQVQQGLIVRQLTDAGIPIVMTTSSASRDHRPNLLEER